MRNAKEKNGHTTRSLFERQLLNCCWKGKNNRTRGKRLETFFLLSCDMCSTNERNTLRHLLGSLSFFCSISTEPGNKTLLDVTLRMLLVTSCMGFVFLDAGGIRWSAGSLSSMALALNTRKTRLDNDKNYRLNCS